MNYRHAYHAGNFADVVKHVLLTRVIAYFLRKDTPFFTLDTHAGVGEYDLTSAEAQKTLEYENGISRFMQTLSTAPKEVQELCADYINLIKSLNSDKVTTYPGSPLVAQKMIRRSDRLSLVELHPADYSQLEEKFNWAKNTKTHNLDAWVAMKAQLPPKEKRGLVLIDPPFEDRDEFNAVLRAVYEAQRRFPTGTYMLWYPLKNMPMAASFTKVLSGMELGRTLDIRVMIDKAANSPKFIGTGMVIINPPYVLDKELEILLPWLTRTFETAKDRGTYSVFELVGEKRS